MPKTTTVGTRLDAALLALQLQAAGPALDFTKDRVTTSQQPSGRPPDYGDEHAAWLERAERLVEGICASLSSPEQRKPIAELHQAIWSYEGRSAVYVAYHEHCSIDTVRRVRQRKGLDDHGFRKPAALTSRVIPAETGVGQEPSAADDTNIVRWDSPLERGNDG